MDKALLKAKFHYTSWFRAGSEPASVMEFGRKHAPNRFGASSEPGPNKLA